MINTFYSCFGRTESTIVDDIKSLLDEAKNYKNNRNFPIPNIVTDKEEEYFNYLLKTYEGIGMFPSLQIFVQGFPEVQSYFLNPSEPLIAIAPEDLKFHIFDVIDARINIFIGNKINKLNELIKANGITPEIEEELDKCKAFSNRNKALDIQTKLSAKANYDALLQRSSGLRTGIKAIDEKIGGMNSGTVNVIAGFTSQFKTTFAINVAHLNSQVYGYNIAYITLEMPKNDMYWNLLSCHSYMSQFSKYRFISHDKMRRTLLTPEEADYLFNVVEPDLQSPTYTDSRGNVRKKGEIVFLDESDFKSFTFGEIQSVLREVDKKLDGGLDALIVDYIQLCKFNANTVNFDETSSVNAYTSFFRRLSQTFKKEYDPVSGKSYNKEITVLLLSQIRRDSWRKAVNHNGVYDITCMSDSSEIEKSAARIFTTYTTEDLKERKIAQVQILKNRSGQTMQNEPAEVFADGEAYVFYDEDMADVNTFAGNDMTASLSAQFDSSSNALLDLLGAGSGAGSMDF